jgi:hypothetical protein
VVCVFGVLGFERKRKREFTFSLVTVVCLDLNGKYFFQFKY